MKIIKPAVSVEIARKNLVWRTSALEAYKNASMVLLEEVRSNEESRSVYRVENKSVTVIFKVTVCPTGIAENVRRIEEEFEQATKAYQAARDGVVVPISFEEIVDNNTNE